MTVLYGPALQGSNALPVRYSLNDAGSPLQRETKAYRPGKASKLWYASVSQNKVKGQVLLSMPKHVMCTRLTAA